jgi:hypothetical protein
MPSSRKLSLIAIAVGLAALLVGIAIDASGRAERMAGSNLVNQTVGVRDGGLVRDVVPVATLPPGGRLCEPWTVPADTAALRYRVFTSSPTLPALTAEVVAGGRTVSSGTLAAGPRRDTVNVPLARIPRTLPLAQACVTNRGPGTVSLGGDTAPGYQAPTVGGKPQKGLVRIEFMRPGEESWWALLPTLTHRFGLGKSHWLGGWTLPFAALLVVAAAALAVRTLLREESA